MLEFKNDKGKEKGFNKEIEKDIYFGNKYG
jgi:hypothetical protein